MRVAKHADNGRISKLGAGADEEVGLAAMKALETAGRTTRLHRPEFSRRLSPGTEETVNQTTRSTDHLEL